MKNSIVINELTNSIELTKKFADKAKVFKTDEYNFLQEARKDYPTFKVVIKKSSSKRPDSFKGLTYDFMEAYIWSHENSEENIASFLDLRAKSESAIEKNLEAKKYGEIKKWFLKAYPEIEKFEESRKALVA